MKIHVSIFLSRLIRPLRTGMLRLISGTGITSLLILLLVTCRLQGQVASNYTFSSTSGTYSTALTGSTTIFPAGWSALVTNVQLPFVFYFNGKGYSNVWVNSNGFITFGATAPSAAYNNPISNNNGFDGSVSAFGLNNSGYTAALIDAANANAVVCGTQTSGSNTVFVIQWTTSWRQATRPVTGGSDAINFQIRLIQNTNVVEIMYGACTTNLDYTYANLWSPMVGLGGSSTSDFNVRAKTATGTLTTSNTTAGTTSSSYLLFGSASSIPTGLTMDWTPTSSPAACSGMAATPAAVATKGITCSTVGLGLAGLPNATGLTYQWYQSYTGLSGSYTAISGATGATYTATPTQATYYNCNVSCGASSVFSSSIAVGRESACPTVPTYTNACWRYGEATGNGILMTSFILPSGVNSCGTSFSETSASASGYGQPYAGGAGTCINYFDMTYLPPMKMQVGASYAGGTITAGYTNPMYAAIWIDFNDDGLFTGTGEQVGTVAAFINTSSGNVTITIPAVGSGAYYGLHRMRLRCAYNTAVTSSTANMTYGNTKDYMVSILPPNQTITASPVVPPATICAPGATETLTATTNISAGTPSSSSYTYTWSGPSGFGSSVSSATNTATFTPTSTAFSGVYTVIPVSDGAQACAISTINVVVAASAVAPTNPPGAFTITGNTYQGAGNITFTPYSTIPDGYLIVATNSSTAPSNPVDGTTYAVGATGLFGTNSVVVSGSVYGSAPPYSTTALNSNSQYYLYVYPFNIDCSGPKYYTGYPVLIGNMLTTCIAPPTGLTATSPTGTTVNLSWTASVAGGNPTAVTSTAAYTYTIHAYLDAGLTTEAIGYPVSGITATSYTATGLSVGTTYYFVITSTATGACGSNSTSASNTTICTGSASVPLLQNFESSAVNNLSPNCWTGNAAQLSGAGGVYKNGGYLGSPFAARSGVNYYQFLGTGYTTTVYANQWLVSPALSLTPGTYNVQFWYITNSSWTGLKAEYSTNGTLPSYTTTDMTGGITIGTALSSVNTGTWTLYSGTMTITTAGTYYVGIDAQSATNSLGLAIEDIEICKVPVVTVSNGTAPYCALATVTLSSTGSSDINKYSWTGPSGFTSTAANPVVSGLDVGVYSYSLTGVSDPVSSGFGGYCSTGPVATTFTVTPGPSAITGTGAVCPGQTLTLNETTTGGTWSSGTTGVATVGTSGIVTGVAAGTATISYTAACGGIATTVVTINYAPAAISGNFNVCSGLTTTLSDALGGGTWVSGTTANATIGLTDGIVTGAGTGGTSTITYTLGGCPATAIVTVSPALPAITGTAIVCPTSTTTLNIAATGGSWSSNNSNISIGTGNGIVTGATTGTSVVSYISGVCYTTKVATVSALPTATVNASGPICAGGTVTLTATPAGSTNSYVWAGASLASTTNASTTATPSATNTYSLTASNSAITGCPSSTYTISVTVRTAPTAAPANSSPICNGGTVSLTANPGGSTTNYSWSGSNLSSSTATNPTATPTGSAVYTLSVTDGTTDAGCNSTYTTSVTVNATPTAATTNDGPICAGGTVHLSATPGGGANTYTWSGAGLSSTTAQNPTATPTTTTVYSLTVTNGTSASGCAPITVYTTAVTVNNAPTAAPTNSGPICAGGTVTLTANPANGASTYTWSGANLSSTTAQNPTATPTTTSVYSLTVTNGTSASGCSPTTVYTTSVTVKSTPTAAPTNNGYICTGGTVSLSANPGGGATAFTWSGNNIGTTNTANTSATPTTTSVYSLTVSDGTTDAGCSPTTVYTTSVTVHSTPSASPANDGYICTGGTVNLTANPANGATVYAWSGASLSTSTAQNPTAMPTTTGVYSLTVSDGSGQPGCAPTTIYTTSVTVNNVPTAAPTNNGPVCNGGTVGLTANPADGASVYTWSGSSLSSTTAQNPTATPTTTSVYSLTVTDGSGRSGCSPATVYTTSVTVKSTPTAAPANDGYICAGGTVNLTANPAGGATVFTWNGTNLSAASAENPTATPTVTAVYSLTVSDGSGQPGCAPATVYTTSVTVNNTPTATPSNSGPICVGGTVMLHANPANGASIYTWSGSALSSTTDQNPTATPTGTAVYSLTVTDGSGRSGCSPATTYTTSVTVKPTPTATPDNDGYICAGGTVNLIANPAGGATTFTWSGSDLGSASAENTTATPTVTSIYSLTVSDGTTDAGCSPAIVYTTSVTVHAAPSASPANDGYICVGGTVNLIANPANGTAVFAWSGTNLSSATDANPTATPTASEVYSLTVSDGSGQSGCAPATVYTTSVTVNAMPTASPTNSGPICAGGTVTLAANPANGANTYTWSGNDLSSTTDENPTATPSSTNVYSLTVSDGSGQSGCAPATVYTTSVTVKPTPTAAPTNNGYICAGGTVSLSANPANGATVFTWSGTDLGSASAENTTATPTANSVYSLTVSDGTTDPGCSPATVYTTSVTVHAAPSASPANDGAICIGGTVHLTANPANSATVYTWNGADLASTTMENPTASPTATAIYSLTISDGSSQPGCAPATVYTTSVTVKNAPALIQASNDGPICTGTTLHLSADGATDVTGYSWTGPVTPSGANTASASVASATTVATGTYTVVVNNGTGSGCTATYTTAATVNELPIVASITPSATELCEGASVSFTAGAVSGAGTLISYNWNGPAGYTTTTTSNSITIDPLTTTASGNYSLSVTYTGTGCVSSIATTSIIVNSRPVVGSLSIDPSALCAGDVTTLTASSVTGTGSVISYSWSGPAGYASTTATNVQTYTIPGPTAAGAYSVSVTYEGVGCVSDITASPALTVNPAPYAGTISGTAEICPGTTSTLSATVAGGVWNSDATGIATVDASSGIVSGVAEGTATISYAATNSCGTATATYVMTVHPLPLAGTITGTAALCPATTTTITDGVTGGVWTSGTIAVATVGTDGVVSGVAPGVSTISYAVTNFCGTAYATKEVTVNVLPFAGSISGTDHVCPATTVTLSSTVSGGIWSSDAPGTATVSGTTGVVTGVAAGEVPISYSYANSCGIDIAIYAMTVDPMPAVTPVLGAAVICPGTTATLSDATAGGVWSSGATGIATVGTSGVVTGAAPGTATISYTTSTVCGSISATSIATVNPVPDAGVISGPSLVCFTSAVTLSNTISGGIWSSSAPAIAPVSSTGVVSGMALGGSNISYTVGSSCGLTATSVYSVTVSPLPNAGVISGTSAICEGGTLTLSSTVAGGTWQSASTAIATVGTMGDVRGMGTGTTVITYLYTNSCGSAAATAIVTVDVTNIPIVDIDVNPGLIIRPGTTATFTATVAHGGTAPAYQWDINGTVVSGATTNIFIPASLANGDLVSCHVQGTGPCDMPSFNTVMIQFQDLTNTPVATGKDEILIAPNPNKGSFSIRGMISSAVEGYSFQLTDMLGQIVYSGFARVENGILNERVSLPNQVSNGMYLLTLRTPDGEGRTFHIVIEQ